MTKNIRKETSLYFNKNIKQLTRQYIMDVAFLRPSNIDKHLGLQCLVGRSQISIFKVIIERIGRRLDRWKIEFLSQIEKEILIKTVVLKYEHLFPTKCFVQKT